MGPVVPVPLPPTLDNRPKLIASDIIVPVGVKILLLLEFIVKSLFFKLKLDTVD